MNDRLDAVEKKIQDLEQSIPEEVEEWRKLHKVNNCQRWRLSKPWVMEILFTVKILN